MEYSPSRFGTFMDRGNRLPLNSRAHSRAYSPSGSSGSVSSVLYKGVPNITWKLLTTKPSYLTKNIGILPDILNTFYIVIATLVVVLPLGVGAAIYLTEYATNKKLVAVIEYAAETLSGIPSIIYGLVGMLFFCEFLKMQTSILAGAYEP